LVLIANGLESTINIITLFLTIYLVIYLTPQPPDAEHPYGHEKYSASSAVLTSIAMVAIAVYIIMNAYYKANLGYMVSMEAAYIAPISIIPPLINYVYFRYLSYKYLEIGFTAEARHQFIDFLDSIITLVGVYGAVSLTYIFDLISASILSMLILFTAAWNLKDASYILLDYGLSPEIIRDIVKMAKEEPEIRSCHEVRSRKLGNNYYVDMHIEVDPNYPIIDAHEVAHRIEEKIKKRYREIRDIVIHIEPA
jgi:cation diffusion facilitator family transporter